MVKFLDYDADIIEKSVDNMTEINYEIEKTNLTHNGKIGIDLLYEKKIKIVEMETLKTISTLLASARCEILHNTDKHIKSAVADVNKVLKKIRENKTQYKKILKQLLLQAMYKILEKELNFILVSDDIECVKSMIDELKKSYLRDTGINVKINIENYSLSIEEIGGVMITAKNGKIIVKNTLVGRLLDISQQSIPLIRSGLFGPNPSRIHSSVNHHKI